MDKIANPLEYIIWCYEWNFTPSSFDILNAKDELKRLRKQIEDTSVFKNVAWATINGRGDMFNLSMIYNQFANEDALIPLYRNEKEYKEKYGKLSK